MVLATYARLVSNEIFDKLDIVLENENKQMHYESQLKTQEADWVSKIIAFSNGQKIFFEKNP